MLALYPRKLNSEQIDLLMGSTALTVTCRRLDLSLALVLTPVSNTVTCRRLDLSLVLVLTPVSNTVTCRRLDLSLALVLTPVSNTVSGKYRKILSLENPNYCLQKIVIEIMT